MNGNTDLNTNFPRFQTLGEGHPADEIRPGRRRRQYTFGYVPLAISGRCRFAISCGWHRVGRIRIRWSHGRAKCVLATCGLTVASDSTGLAADDRNGFRCVLAAGRPTDVDTTGDQRIFTGREFAEPPAANSALCDR